MKKNNFFLILGSGLVLICMLALRPITPTRPVDVKLSPEQLIELNAINTQMLSIVTKYGSLSAITDPGDAMAYRWLAIAKYYVQLDPIAVLHRSNTVAIDTAMSSIFAKYGSLTAISDPGDLLAFRWLAMAKQYEH